MIVYYGEIRLTLFAQRYIRCLTCYGESNTILHLIHENFFITHISYLYLIIVYLSPNSGWLQLDVLMHAKRRKVHADDDGAVVLLTNCTSFMGIL